MAAQNKFIAALQKSKTKFDIAFYLDHLIPYSNHVLLLDHYSKAELVAKKEEYLRNHITI